jgi:DNA modification methylase
MIFETWPIDKFIEYARNPRKNDHAVDSIAAAIKEFGFRVPIVAKSDGLVVDGHLRLKAAKKIGLSEAPVILADDLTDAQIKAFRISVNKMAELADWDMELLALELDELKELDFDIDLTGFTEDEVKEVREEADSLDEPTEGLTADDEVPEAQEKHSTQLGDVWILGEHRVMCGDSTNPEHIKKLMHGKKAQLIHADPPYGMGKESDGVANDNLYDDKLDGFQMAWWKAIRPYTLDNASAYIWGNSKDLWRLWYKGGLKDSERLTLRNQLVWDKKSVQGVGAENKRSFPTVTEHCIFFMLGEQGFNNNADNYWDGFEPIRKYLAEEMEKCGGSKNWKEALGNHMGKHYFTKSQWTLPTEEAYKKLQLFAKGEAFKKDYEELKKDFYKTRAYFDNTHDNMTDVWEFPRVTGEERHGHATPKPVAMMERVMMSSLPRHGLCFEPFGGSGSTLMGAHKTQRTCYTMELQPQYVDVIIKRWQDYTGLQAIHEETGKTFVEAAI